MWGCEADGQHADEARKEKRFLRRSCWWGGICARAAQPYDRIHNFDPTCHETHERFAKTLLPKVLCDLRALQVPTQHRLHLRTALLPVVESELLDLLVGEGSLAHLELWQEFPDRPNQALCDRFPNSQVCSFAAILLPFGLRDALVFPFPPASPRSSIVA